MCLKWRKHQEIKDRLCYRQWENLSLQGRDLGGWSSQKVWGGGGPCIRPPNILGSSVVGCARKYEQSKKRCYKGILFWNSGCSSEERVICDIEHSKRYRKSGKRKGKSEKLGQWLKKVMRNYFGCENGHYEILVREKNVRPPKLDARSPPLSHSIVHIKPWVNAELDSC